MQAFGHNLVTVKEGAELLAHTDHNDYQVGGDHPLFVTWELQGSRVFACTAEIAQMAMTFSHRGTDYTPWDYYGDFISNLMLYLDRRPVPQDVDLVHSVRSAAFLAKTRISLLLSLVEFVESFGANAQGVMRSIGDVEVVMDGTKEAYFELRFEDLLDAYEEVGVMLDRVEGQALDLKDRTLLWVYVIEWLGVTGKALFAGFVLWTIMVRRRLYREASGTRLTLSAAYPR